MLRRMAVVAGLALGLALPAVAADKGMVLVVGAGRTGTPLAKILAADGYKVRMLMRDPNKVAELPAGTEKVKADITQPQTLPAAMKGVDYVISTVGASGELPENIDYKGVANLADAAKAAMVKQFVLMSSTSAGDSNPETFLNKRNNMVLMWKGRGEDHLRKTGVPYTIVRPGGLGDCDPGKAGLTLADPEGLVGERSCRSDIALVMAASLGNRDALGKTIGVVTDPKGKPDVWRADFAKLKKD